MGRVGWLLAVALLLAGCQSSSYSKLKDESSIPELAALEARTREHQNHTAMVPTKDLDGRHTIRVAVHQIEGEHDRILVFLHGVFSDSTAWRFIVGDLAADHDLWLVDLPGCGLSDKPDPDTLGPAGYSPADLASRTLEALRDRLKDRGGSDKICLVGHSLGGMVALRMFADAAVRERYGDVLSRIDRMILSAPVDVEMNRPDPFFEQIARITGTEVRLGTALGVLRERVAEGTLNSVDDPEHRALRQEADSRVAFLNDRPTFLAMQAMLRKAISWHGNRPDWEKNQAIVAGYQFVKPEVLILWGDRDEVLPIAMGYKQAVQLPHAHLLPLPRVMHSPHLEMPGLTARIIRQYADTGTIPTLPDPSGAPAPSEKLGP
jgi:pimeloyl-ACP methyl ester carboxylesterase